MDTLITYSIARMVLAEPPVPLSKLWVEKVNHPQYETEVQSISESIRRGRPYGGETWQSNVARQLGLQHSLGDREL